MQVESFLSIATYIAGLTGLGSVSGVVIAIMKWSKSERAKGREEQKRADELTAYKKESTENITRVREQIERKVDAGIVELSTKIEIVAKDVVDVKGDIRNGGLKEAVTVMQSACGAQMATLTTRLADHIALSGHPGVTEDISALQARVNVIEQRTRN